MEIDLVPTLINDVKILNHEIFRDKRGFLTEVFRKDIFYKKGLPHNFVQIIHSGSENGVLRGLHFQWEPPMGKLMRVIKGEAFLVAVDIRKESPTLGKSVCEIISEENKKQMWAPAGFARGFCVLSQYAEIEYLVTGIWNDKFQSGIKWNDPELKIDWPISNPIVSDKDENAMTLKEWLIKPESENFKF